MDSSETPPPMTYDLFIEEARGFVNFVAGNWDSPDDDVNPVVFLGYKDDEGKDAMTVGILDPTFFQHKNMLGEVILPTMVREVNASQFAFISSTWMLKAEDADDAERIQEALEEYDSLEHHPDRMEAVIIMSCDREISRMDYAEIIRTENNPPMLGPWDRMDKGEVGGRMIDTVREAMR